MTDNEREQVLKMIADGKISAEEGLKLMHVLDEDQPEDLKPQDPGEPKPTSSGEPHQVSNMELDPRINRIKSTVARLWQIPLWIGIAILLGSALGMFALIQADRMNFWFYFLILPLLTGVLIIAAAAGSRHARWLFVDVQDRSDEKPHRVFLGFPLPLKLTSWVLRTFRPHIDNVQPEQMDAILTAIESGLSSEQPLIVNVDEGEDGDRVKVYIG
jgi:hypothetical protein